MNDDLKNQESGQVRMMHLMIILGMVAVIAVIGIFKWKGARSSALQNEAKISLAGAHAALKTFSTEHKSFTGCLHKAGFRPESGARFYSLGFARKTVLDGPNPDCEPVELSETVQEGPNAWAATAGKGTAPVAYDAQLQSLDNLSPRAFMIPAVGSIAENNLSDVWTVDQNGTVLQLIDGTGAPKESSKNPHL